jgi:hypothetical protein
MLGEHSADWLDPEPVTMIVDELNHHGSRGSSSRANNDDAPNRILLARLSARFSASRFLKRVASLVLTLGRLAAPIAACFAHPRKVSGLTPVSCPIRISAAFNDCLSSHSH